MLEPESRLLIFNGPSIYKFEGTIIGLSDKTLALSISTSLSIIIGESSLLISISLSNNSFIVDLSKLKFVTL